MKGGWGSSYKTLLCGENIARLEAEGGNADCIEIRLSQTTRQVVSIHHVLSASLRLAMKYCH
jgi:hypothetical protein